MKKYVEVDKQTGKIHAGPFGCDDIPDFGEHFHLEAIELVGDFKEGDYCEKGKFRKPKTEELPQPPKTPKLIENQELKALLVEVIEKTGVGKDLSPEAKASFDKLKGER